MSDARATTVAAPPISTVDPASAPSRIHALLLAALLAFVAAAHFAWLTADGSFAGFNELAFLEWQLKFNQALLSAPAAEWLSWHHLRPAGFFLVGSLFQWIGGGSILSLRCLSAFFHLLWIGLVYAAGKRWHSPTTGLAAAFVAGLSPLGTIMAHQYAPFLLEAALTTLAAYTALADGRRHPGRWIAINGLAFGAALWIERFTPFLYLTAISLSVLILWREPRDRLPWRGIVRSLAAVWLIALAIAGPSLVGWARENWSYGQALFHQADIPGRESLYYLRYLVPHLTGAAALPLLIAGAVVLALRDRRRAWLILLWLGLPLAVLSAAASKNMVYTLSLTTPLALLAGRGLSAVPGRGRRAVIGGALLLVHLATWAWVVDSHGALAAELRPLAEGDRWWRPYIPKSEPKAYFSAAPLLAALAGVAAEPQDVWIAPTAAWPPDDDLPPVDWAVVSMLTAAWNRVPGRYLLVGEKFFAGAAFSRPGEVNLVRLPAAAARALPLLEECGPYRFVLVENDEWSTRLATALGGYRLERTRGFYAGLLPVTLWTASPQ
ncbi:MAG: hypothetical protein GX444_10010 [Myxococcales bacterium]|nr:hypothetical protein [Myxococcales bacterium]